MHTYTCTYIYYQQWLDMRKLHWKANQHVSFCQSTTCLVTGGAANENTHSNDGTSKTIGTKSCAHYILMGLTVAGRIKTEKDSELLALVLTSVVHEPRKFRWLATALTLASCSVVWDSTVADLQDNRAAS